MIDGRLVLTYRAVGFKCRPEPGLAPRRRKPRHSQPLLMRGAGGWRGDEDELCLTRFCKPSTSEGQTEWMRVTSSAPRRKRGCRTSWKEKLVVTVQSSSLSERDAELRPSGILSK